MELPIDPVIQLLGLSPKNPETSVQKNLCTPMFIAAQFTKANIGSNLSAHQKMSGSRNYGTCTQWNTTQPNERMKYYFCCDSMDGTE